MRGLVSLLNTARDGLQASSYAMGVTGQNVANVNTPGYARRDVVLETRGQGLNGVHATGVKRAADQILERREYQSTGLSSGASEHDSRLAELESLFDDAGGSGLADSVGALFGAFQSLASNPNDPTARANVLGRADVFSQRVSGTADALATARDDLFGQARDTVKDVNQRAQTIAKLNQEIAHAKAAGQDTSDLEDQRNQALLGLASLIDVRTVPDASGAVLVQSAGTTLVEGGNARTFSVDLAPGGNLRLLSSTAGGGKTDVTNFLTGGKLAGIREARDVDYAAVQQQLDTFAFNVATAVNNVHEAGFGLDGVSGRALFDLSASSAGAARSLKVSADVAGQPNRIAASSSATALPGNSDNAVALSNLQDALVVNGRSITNAYADIVGNVGQRKAASEQNVSLRKSIAEQIHQMRESVSGVSLDEEMVAMTKYQRAYEASAKVLATVDQLLEELLARLG